MIQIFFENFIEDDNIVNINFDKIAMKIKNYINLSLNV